MNTKIFIIVLATVFTTVSCNKIEDGKLHKTMTMGEYLTSDKKYECIRDLQKEIQDSAVTDYEYSYHDSRMLTKYTTHTYMMYVKDVPSVKDMTVHQFFNEIVLDMQYEKDRKIWKALGK